MISLISLLIPCASVIYVFKEFLNYLREERDHVDTVALSEALQKELSKIQELKTKIDTIALKVGLR